MGGASRQTWSFDALVEWPAVRADPAPRSADRRRPRAGERHLARSPHRIRRAAGGVQGRRPRAGGALRAWPRKTVSARPSSCAGSAAPPSPASCCAIRPMPTRARSRAPARRDRGAHPRGRHGGPAAAPASRGGRPGRRPAWRSTRSTSRSRCSSWRSPGSTGAGPPRPPRPLLVHGDFRTGNYLADETRRDRDPRLGGRPSRRPDRGSRMGVREELALRFGRQAGRRLRQPRGTVVSL